MRDLKELYTLLLETYREDVKNGRRTKNHGGFVCIAISDLYEKAMVLSKEEYTVLIEHFKSQRPTKNLHPTFYTNPLCKDWGDVWFRWYDYDKAKEEGVNDDTLGINIRIEFLEAIIKSLD